MVLTFTVPAVPLPGRYTLQVDMIEEQHCYFHEVGSERGRLYLVMGFMPGGSLRAKLASGPLPWREAGIWPGCCPSSWLP